MPLSKEPVAWPAAPPIASPATSHGGPHHRPAAQVTAPVWEVPAPVPVLERPREPAGADRLEVRVDGVDLARFVAMAGMVVAHFVERTGTGGPADALRAFVDGRAMPLFVLLGGVSISLLVARNRHPDRALLVRAAVLLPLGLLLQDWTRYLAIILQYYALFFVVAIALRRLPGRALLVVAGVVTLLAGWTYQRWEDLVPGDGRWEGWVSVREPWRVVGALVIDGYYPLLPTLAFIAVGMWIGRQRLTTRFGAVVAMVGASLGIVGYLGGRAFAPLPVERAPWFSWERLLDTAGHSQMPAWTIGAIGTAMVALGLCLVVAPLGRRALRPLVVAGQGALTFYVAQALLIRWTPELDTTSALAEYALVAAMLVGFVGIAVLWRRRFRRLPLEAALHRLSR